MADFIIVGAGSAGCVLANRLSADPAVNVVVLEAGGKDGNLLYRLPAGFFPLMQTGKGNWNFETTPQPGLNGRTQYFPRGKVVGGSSAINGMVVSRGNPADYDRWAQMGNPGWSFQDCLPFFKKIENFADGDAQLRGHSGPVGVTRVPVESMNPISQAWLKAGIEAGHAFNPDINCATPLGVAQMQGNFIKGIRQSASACYLNPILHRPNLTVITGATVKRVIFKSGRACAIEYVVGGQLKTLHADREVILSGGVINSPQILQLSGIGAAADLRPHGIEVVHELAGVGHNMRDHLSVAVKQRITQPLSVLKSTKPLSMLKSLGQYLLFKSGAGAASGLEAWAHLNSREGLDYPDIQTYCVNLMYNDHGRDVIQEEGFMAVSNHCRPLSTGHVRIRSSDPLEHPEIDPNYLSEFEDVRVLREAVRLSREIISQPAYESIRGSEYAPGADITSNDAIDAYIRNTANTLYHPVGTCKMGQDDLAVVDSQLKVRGLDGLRVVDASIMPDIISGNTNFPVMMIAEKIAETITLSK